MALKTQDGNFTKSSLVYLKHLYFPWFAAEIVVLAKTRALPEKSDAARVGMICFVDRPCFSEQKKRSTEEHEQSTKTPNHKNPLFEAKLSNPVSCRVLMRMPSNKDIYAKRGLNVCEN